MEYSQGISGKIPTLRDVIAVVMDVIVMDVRNSKKRRGSLKRKKRKGKRIIS